MDIAEWLPIKKRLAGLYPNFPAEAETWAAYYDLLSGYDADIVLGAIERHARTSKWFPTIAELLERIVPEHQVRREWDHLDFSHAALPSGDDPTTGRLLPEGRDA